MDARKTLKAINAVAGTKVQGHGLRATRLTAPVLEASSMTGLSDYVAKGASA